MRLSVGCVLLCTMLVLAACGGDRAAGQRGNGDGVEGNLPAPEAGSGSITGMPDVPGPGQVGVPAQDGLPPDTPVASDGDIGLPPIGEDNFPGDAEPSFTGDVDAQDMPLPTGEPSSREAAAVVRDYYGSINARQYDHAYALWADGGRSSGQSQQQFAAGFADTAGVSVQIDTPGRIDAAAGSRYIEVPLAITATRSDGSVHKYRGVYTLRRVVVDGANAEQRQWRIGSAEIREVHAGEVDMEEPRP